MASVATVEVAHVTMTRNYGFVAVKTDDGSHKYRHEKYPDLEVTLKLKNDGTIDPHIFASQVVPLVQKVNMRDRSATHSKKTQSGGVSFKGKHAKHRFTDDEGMLPDIIGIQHENNMTLYADPFPEFHHAYQYVNTNEDANRAISAREFDVFKKGFKAYLQDIEALQKEKDLTITRQGEQVTFSHPTGVTKTLDCAKKALSAKTAGDFLRSMTKEIDDAQKGRVNRLIGLKTKGFDLTFHPESQHGMQVEIAHPHAKTIGWKTASITLHGDKGWIGIEDSRLLKKADELSIAPEYQAAAAPGETFNPKSWIAREGKDNKTDIIVHISALASMDALRSGNRSWLDLLNPLAELPNVDRVIIDESDVFLKCLGQIPDEKGGWLVTDERHKQFAKHSLAVAFFSQCSQLIQNDEGKVSFVEGSNPKIVLWRTPEQSRLFAELRAKLRAAPAGQLPSKTLENDMANLRDESRFQPFSYTQSSIASNPCIVISDNATLAFEFARMQRSSRRNNLQHPHTHYGEAVGISNTYDFLEALHNAYNGKLAAKLGEPDTHPHAIIDQIEKTGQHKFTISRQGHVLPGIDDKGKTGETLQHLVARGVHHLESAQAALGAFTAIVGSKGSGAQRGGG